MCNEIKKVKKNNLKVGAAVGTSEKELIRARQLIDSGVRYASNRYSTRSQ